MNMQSKNKTRSHVHSMNYGVLIIFLVITLLFLIALTKSNYSKQIFTARTQVYTHTY